MASTGSGASRTNTAATERWYELAILVVFALIVLRLFYIQVVTGKQHRLASWDNIIQTVDTPAPRGDLYDRAGRPLAKNINIFQLLYIPPTDIDDYFPSAGEAERLKLLKQEYDYLRTGEDGRYSLPEIQHLSVYLGASYVELMQRIETERKRVYGYQPVTLVTELTRDQVVYIGEHSEQFKGMLIEQYAFRRDYPLGTNAAHLVGYTARISEKDVALFSDVGYGPREYVGKEGVERQFEQLLHGSPGRRDIEVDRNRVFQKIVQQVKPTKGSDLYLTIDANIQAKAQQILGSRPGAMIVCNLRPGHEGEIMALAASPGYDPRRVRESEYYAKLLTNPRKPLLNRAYRHAYPPGSTFKIVTATAALQEKKVTPGTSWYCSGFIMLGKKRFNCHHEYGHQGVTLLEAIAESCDVAFYRIGLRLPDAPATLKHYGELFGLGHKVGIGLPNEVAGVIPDAEWKRQHFQKLGWLDELAWYDGDTANYAIGQGFLTATPLQVLWMSNLVATDGVSYPPRLLYAKTADGRIAPAEVPRPSKRPISTEALATVKQGMRMAVTMGTCKSLNLSGMSVCAKTGTAETGKRGQDDHAWIVGFYPATAPKYGFVVFIENGGLSSEIAVPQAKQLLQFLKKYQPQGDVQQK